MSDEGRAMREVTPEEAELARVLGLATTLWAELKACGWPVTRLGLALAEAEERGKAAARAEGEAAGRAAEREECARTLEWMASHPHQQADVANALKTGAGLLRIRAEAEARARAAGGGQ